MVFLRLCDLGDEEHNKAITRNCVPQKQEADVDAIYKFTVCLAIEYVRLLTIYCKFNIEFYTCLYYNEDNT